MFYFIDPNTGQIGPRIKESEDSLDIAEAVGKELGQDIVKIRNAKIIIQNLVYRLRSLEK